MNKSLSYGKLESGIACCFNILIGVSHRYFFFTFILPSRHMNLRDENAHTLVQRTDIFSCKFPAQVSLILDNPFLVPSLCKLNHIILCFIQISTKSPAKLLIPVRESTVFFLSHPRCFGLIGKFVFVDYLFLVIKFLLILCKSLDQKKNCNFRFELSVCEMS